jgi:hypothetical protein
MSPGRNDTKDCSKQQQIVILAEGKDHAGECHQQRADQKNPLSSDFIGQYGQAVADGSISEQCEGHERSRLFPTDAGLSP